MEQGECMVSNELRRQSGRFATASFRLSAPAAGVHLGVFLPWHPCRALQFCHRRISLQTSREEFVGCR